MRWDDVVYRPIEGRWHGEMTPAYRRKRSQFSAPWGRTVQLLERELDNLGAKNVVLQVALEEADIRRDGRPRAQARAAHPGVILAFNSKYGPLQYSTDVYVSWQENIRAIALALEALRTVDRYGVSKRGEQYAGWKALPQSTEVVVATEDEAERIILNYTSDLYAISDIVEDGPHLKDAIKVALRRTHPDTGGRAEDFHKVMMAKRLLEGLQS